MATTASPIEGVWFPTYLRELYYGPNSVEKHLLGLSCIRDENSKVLIITGNSLANKTQLIKQVENLLQSKHAGTFSKIGQHAPVAQIEEVVNLVQDSNINSIISIGGGSPIDSAKVVVYRVAQAINKKVSHITIPTTISAAECTSGAGYTNPDGVKNSVGSPELIPPIVLYDSKFALETPPTLWLSTGMRAMDHAIELMYHPDSSEIARMMAEQAAAKLFKFLPLYRENPKDETIITELQLAAFSSLGFIGYNLKRPLGLSHTLGYALGSPYGIPHGITSCLTLGHVVKLKAHDPVAAEQLGRMARFVGIPQSGDVRQDAKALGQKVLDLVSAIGLKSTLTDWQVGRDQIPIIVERATKLSDGPVFDSVSKLVEGLY